MLLFLAQQLEANRYNPFTGLRCHRFTTSHLRSSDSSPFLFPYFFSLAYLKLARFTLPAEPAALKPNGAFHFLLEVKEKRRNIGADPAG